MEDTKWTRQFEIPLQTGRNQAFKPKPRIFKGLFKCKYTDGHMHMKGKLHRTEIEEILSEMA